MCPPGDSPVLNGPTSVSFATTGASDLDGANRLGSIFAVVEHATGIRLGQYRRSGVARRFTAEAVRQKNVAQALSRRANAEREAVRFLRHDLLSADKPTEGRCFDLLMWRNVLSYFDRHVQARVFDLPASSLTSGGYLCLGEAEQLRPSHTMVFDTIDKTDRLYLKR